MIRHELSVHLVIVVFTFLIMVIFCSGQAFSNNGQSNEDLPREQYEYIRPYRSSSSGDFISYDLSTEKEEKYRKYLKYMQQHSEFDIPASIPKDIASTIFYTFYAFDKQFLLNITLSQHLVAPNTSIEKHLDNGTVSTNPVQKNCFYQGTVNGSNDSIVSINNCNVGLNGWIQWNNEDYILTFSESQKLNHSQSNSTNGLLHVIYKTNQLDSKVNLALDSLYSKKHMKMFEEFRWKRSTHFQRMYFVETLVAVDSSMYAFHKGIDIESYVIQLINMVNQLFNHPSLDSKLTLVVIKIIYLNERQSTEIETSGSRDSSLQSVVLLSQNVSKSSSHIPDFTAFLIRKTLLVAGLSMTNSMCKNAISCAVVRDDGLLQTAFVIAHEVGHTLGMVHDDDIKDCEKDADRSSVMSSLVKAHSGYYWSECSRRAFRDNIESKFCLLDNPFEVKKPSPMLPGELYSRDQQCYFNHGEGYKHCFQGKQIDCEHLRCADYSSPSCLSVRWAKPPLPGTFCKTDHWCMNGSCVHINYQDGGWSKWTAWTVCSRICGIGVSKRRRYCDSPRAQHGGKKCIGDSFEYKLCNIQDCRNPIQDPRADACRDYLSNWMHEGAVQAWVPSELHNRSLGCKLSCVSLNTKSVVVTDQDVIDGVACSYENPHGICIDGKCVRIGCDKVLGSELKFDKCGVCGGDNSTCQEIHAMKKRRLKRNYQVAFKIPIGAYDVLVEEVSKTNNFISLKDDLNRRYILNSKNIQGPSCDFVFHKVNFVYINEDGFEMLKTRGPMRSNITVLLGNGNDKSPIIVHYSYVINRENKQRKLQKNKRNTYYWAEKGWSVCSASCGNGTSVKKFECIEEGSEHIVDKFYCLANNPPLIPVSRVCKERECIVPQWRVSNWSECSKTCGLRSYQIRWVDCVLNINGVNETVPIRLCHAERPAISKPCNVSLCEGKWKRSSWSQCSVSCEKGVQTRTITCVGPDGQVNPDYVCQTKDKNRSSKPCDMGPCVCSLKAGGKICSLRTYQQYCKLSIYREQCCSTCLKQRILLEAMTKASKTATANRDAAIQKVDREAKRANKNSRKNG